MDHLQNHSDKKHISVINYDNAQCRLKRTINKFFLKSFFIIVISQFRIKDDDLPLGIFNKSCSQFYSFEKFVFQTFFENFLITKFCSSVNILKKNYTLSLYYKKSNNLNHYLFYNSVIFFDKLNNSMFWQNKDFFHNMFNICPLTFFHLSHVLLSIQKFALPIFYTNIPNGKMYGNCHKLPKRSCQEKKNVYKINISVFHYIWNYFKDIKFYDFFKITSISKLKKQRLSSDFYYFSISQFDQILTQMNFLDAIMAKSQIEFCAKKATVINELFEKIQFNLYFTQCNKQRSLYYGQCFFNINYYSKLYLLDYYVKNESNRLKILNSSELLSLNRALINKCHPEIELFQNCCSHFYKQAQNSYKHKKKIHFKPLKYNFEQFSFQQSNVEQLNIKYEQEYKDCYNIINKLIDNNLVSYEKKEKSTYIQTNVLYKSRHEFMSSIKEKNNQLLSLKLKKQFDSRLILESIQKECGEKWHSFAINLFYQARLVHSLSMSNKLSKFYLIKHIHLHFSKCKCLTNRKWQQTLNIIKSHSLYVASQKIDLLISC